MAKLRAFPRVIARALASMRGRAWWAPAAVVCAIGFVLSFIQPSCAMKRDIRLEAMRSLVDVDRTYMGDPEPSIVAARRLAADSRARIYDADMRVGSAFIYPPIAAALYAPIASLAPRAAHDWLAIANHLLFLGIVGLTLRLIAIGRELRAFEMVAIPLAAALFYPLVHAVELNQATVLVTALLGVAWVTIDRRPAIAGIAFALTLAIKPQLAIVLPLLVWHARRTVVVAVAVAGLLLAVSIAYAGIDNHVDYATKVLPQLSRGYAYYANQSFNGLFNRLLVRGELGIFRQPPASTAVTVLSVSAAIATYTAALVLVRRLRGRGDLAPWVLAIAWLTATLVSPVAWQHHYAPALFVFALLWRALIGEPALRRPWLGLAIAASFALMAGYFETRRLEGAAPRLFASYMFFGAVALAVTLAYVVRRLGSAPQRAARPEVT